MNVWVTLIVEGVFVAVTFPVWFPLGFIVIYAGIRFGWWP